MQIRSTRLVVLSLLLLSIFTIISPVAHAAGVVSQGQNTNVSGGTATCTLTVTSGDLIFDAIAIGGNTETTVTPTDTFSSQFNMTQVSQYSAYQTTQGMFAFWATATSSGSDTITITYSPNSVTTYSTCFDLNGIEGPTFTAIAGSSDAGTNSTAWTVNGYPNPELSTVIMWGYCAATSCVSTPPTFTAGSGFTLDAGTKTIGTNSYRSEYGNFGTGPVNCKMNQGVSQTWLAACIGFAQTDPSSGGSTFVVTNYVVINGASVPTVLFNGITLLSSPIQKAIASIVAAITGITSNFVPTSFNTVFYVIGGILAALVAIGFGYTRISGKRHGITRPSKLVSVLLLLLLLSTTLSFVKSVHAYGLVTQNQNATTSSVATITCTLTVTSGDIIFAGLVVYTAQASTVTPSDSLGNSYNMTQASKFGQYLGHLGTLAFWTTARSSGSDTITMTFSTSTGAYITCWDLTGVEGPSGTLYADTGNGPTLLVNGYPSYEPTTIIGFGEVFTGDFQTRTAGTGFTLDTAGSLVFHSNAGTNHFGASEYGNFGVNLDVACSMGQGQTENWSFACIGFTQTEPPSGGGTIYNTVYVIASQSSIPIVTFRGISISSSPVGQAVSTVGQTVSPLTQIASNIASPANYVWLALAAILLISASLYTRLGTKIGARK